MEIYDKFVQPILQNQVATGLSFTAVLGMVAYQLRQIPDKLRYIFERNFIMQVRVMSSDDAFKWVDLWLSKQLSKQHVAFVILKSNNEDHNWDDTSNKKNSYRLSPGGGTHWFWYRRKFFWIVRNIGEPPSSSTHHGKSGPPLETLWLYTFGRNQQPIQDIIEEAKSAVEETELVPIYLWRGHHWAKVPGKKLRSLSTIVLADGMKDGFVADIERFLTNRDYYEDRGIPWRRGYLISGPPGTGKTSFVLALAAHFKRTLCVLNLGSVGSDDRLFSAILDAPADALILIEDIDCADSSHIRKADSDTASPDEDDNEGITKAGLLNALDGVTTPDGRILVMTTNFPEKLDPALVRPGRADVHYIFDYLGPLEQVRMAELYYGKGVFNPLPVKISPAEMQKAFMMHPIDPNKAHEVLSNAQNHI